MKFVVPPGGFAGFAQMTPASRASLSQGATARSPRRRRRTKSKGNTGRKRASTSRSKRGPKFGSPAWRKKYKLGKKRK